MADPKEQMDELEARKAENEAKLQEQKDQAEDLEREQAKADKDTQKALKKHIKQVEKGIPRAYLGTKNIDNTLANLSKIVEQRARQIKEVAVMDVFMELDNRMKKEMDTIREASQAFNLKKNGEWTTFPPAMHIRNLKGYKVSPEEARITFEILDCEDGDKVEYVNTAQKETPEGNLRNFTASVSYEVKFRVTMIIMRGKPIVTDTVEMDTSGKGEIRKPKVEK